MEKEGRPKKKNCWEFKGCGREPGGKKAVELGICPATTDERLDGVHGGKNAGRACWVLAGTYCGGAVQGTFAQKYKNCAVCDFYKLVREEERGNYEFSIALLNRIKTEK
jgi:hypothetical protein